MKAMVPNPWFRSTNAMNNRNIITQWDLQVNVFLSRSTSLYITEMISHDLFQKPFN